MSVQRQLGLRLMHNAGYLFGGAALAAVLSLVTVIAQARSLGLSDFAVLAVMIAFVAAVERLCAPRPWQAVVQFGDRHRQGEVQSALAVVVRQGLGLDVLGVALGLGLANALIWLVGPRLTTEPGHLWLVSLLSLGLLGSGTGTAIGVLRLLGHFRWLSLHRLIQALVGLLGAGIAGLAGAGLAGFVLAALAATLSANLFLLLLLGRVLRARGVSLARGRGVSAAPDFRRFVGWCWLNRLLELPTKKLDVLLVSVIVSLEAAGLYRLIRQVARVPELLDDPVSEAIYPQQVRLVAERRWAEGVRHSLRASIALLALVAPLCLLLALTAPWWLVLVFGPAFGAAAPALALYLGITVIAVAATPLHPLLIASGQVRSSSIIALACGLVFVVAAVVLGWRFGLVGVVLAQGLQLSMMLVWKAGLLRSSIRARIA